MAVDVLPVPCLVFDW